jgi:GDPmannose 4,6-dehydratase
MKTAVITGITGQDGPLLSKVLLERGCRVVGLVRASSAPNCLALKFCGIDDRVELVPADLSDLPGLIRLFERLRPQEVYNLAAQSSVARSFDEAISTFSFNTHSVINLLEAIRIASPRTRFYQASSSEMYGNVADLPITPNTPMRPVSPYGISKAAAHWIAVNYRDAYGLFVTCGILFNHESALRQPHFVTKKILSAAVRIRNGAGDRLRLGNLGIQRDWGYAPEYVRAMSGMVMRDNPDDFIICTGAAHSLRTFVETTFDACGLDWSQHVDIDESLIRRTEIRTIYGDPTRAQQQLGWRHSLSFREMIAKLVADETAHQAFLAAQG